MRVRAERLRIASWLGCGAWVLIACGGAEAENVEPGAAGATRDDLSAVESGGPGAGQESNRFSTCPTPLGTAEELARTPRSDTNLELLALTLDAGQLTATDETYERIVADMGVIRASAPSLADLAFAAPHDGHTLTLSFGSDAMDALGAGTFTAWDCLLEAYRAEIGPIVDAFPYAPTLFLGGIFDMPRLQRLFEQLPDVVVDINAGAVERTLCVTRDGGHYEYVVDETNSACDSSEQCTGRARYFTSDALGEVTLVDAWGSVAGAPAPDWFHDVCN